MSDTHVNLDFLILCAQFQYGNEIVQTTTTLDEGSNGVLLELACIKASVAGKSSGQ